MLASQLRRNLDARTFRCELTEFIGRSRIKLSEVVETQRRWIREILRPQEFRYTTCFAHVVIGRKIRRQDVKGPPAEMTQQSQLRPLPSPVTAERAASGRSSRVAPKGPIEFEADLEAYARVKGVVASNVRHRATDRGQCRDRQFHGDE